MEKYKLSDSVLGRIVNIIQESLLLGRDCTDAMRLIELTHDEFDTSRLVLTQEYELLVKRDHDELLQRAEELKSQKSSQSCIVTE